MNYQPLVIALKALASVDHPTTFHTTNSSIDIFVMEGSITIQAKDNLVADLTAEEAAFILMCENHSTVNALVELHAMIYLMDQLIEKGTYRG
jgi:hypothetical protein